MLKSSIKITCRPYDGNSKTKAFIELCLDKTLRVHKGYFFLFHHQREKTENTITQSTQWIRNSQVS